VPQTTIHSRPQQGIALTKQNQVKFRRPKIQKPDNWDTVISDWKDRKITAKTAMNLLGLKHSTFYQLLK